MKRTVITIAGLAIAGLSVAACGTAATHTATSPPATHAAPAASASQSAPASTQAAVNYGQQYLNDVAAARHDADVLSADPNASATSPDVIQLGKDMATTGRELLQQTWPANAQADVHSLAVAALAVSNDISNQDLAGVQADLAKGNGYGSAIRAELHI